MNNLRQVKYRIFEAINKLKLKEQQNPPCPNNPFAQGLLGNPRPNWADAAAIWNNNSCSAGSYGATGNFMNNMQHMSQGCSGNNPQGCCNAFENKLHHKEAKLMDLSQSNIQPLQQLRLMGQLDVINDMLSNFNC